MVAPIARYSHFLSFINILIILWYKGCSFRLYPYHFVFVFELFQFYISFFFLKFSRFDILVNGGGSVTLEFLRRPFATKYATVMVPWNQFVTMDVVVMEISEASNTSLEVRCHVNHDHHWMIPVVLSTWQHTQLGACPAKSTVIPESQVC